MAHTKLGRYHILGELGRGAMGTVYRAHDPLIEREVAVKTLHPDLPPEAMVQVRERFLREAKSAGRLNHPNIVTIFDVGEDDGVAYMAMELLEGRSLQQTLGEPERLSFQAVADIVSQIAGALDHAQQLGIVHRDVKPANVVVSASGRAKLTDFGVAYVPSSTMTQTGTMIGSPRYMSPEQVLGLPVDPRSDIFSLGVVLYEMLAGRTPFARPGDSTIFPLINRIVAEPHPPVLQLDPSIPAMFEVVLCKALAKKPEDRYQRAGDMADDLRVLRNVEPSKLGRGPTENEKTLMLVRSSLTLQPQHEKTDVLPVAPAPTASPPPPTAEKKPGEFVLDLDDAFSRDFAAEDQASLRAEEEARQRKAEVLRLWSEAEARKREEFERQRESASQKKSGTPFAGPDAASRRAALDMLKNQASTRSLEEVAAKATADAGLDQSMRAALQYLAEVAREMNSVNPTAGRPYDYVFLGRLPAVTLSNAFTDLRSRKINGKDHGEHLFFRFRIQPAAPAKATLLGAEVARFQEYLKTWNIPFEASAGAKNDFGQVTRSAFTVSAPLPCEVNIRADYDRSSIEIELVNVRRPGRVKCRLEPKEFDDVVDDLARYVLGVDDDFDKILNRR